MDGCARREQEHLAFTQKISEKNSQLQSENNTSSAKVSHYIVDNIHAFFITPSPWVRGSGGNGLPLHSAGARCPWPECMRGLWLHTMRHLCSLGGQCQDRYSHQLCLHSTLHITYRLGGTYFTFSSRCRLSQPPRVSNSQPLDLKAASEAAQCAQMRYPSRYILGPIISGSHLRIADCLSGPFHWIK